MILSALLRPSAPTAARRGPRGRPAAARKALRAVFIGTTEVVPLHVFVPVSEGLRWVDSPVHVSCPYRKGCDGCGLSAQLAEKVASGFATKLQGLKPGSCCGMYGTTEVVPCYKSGLFGVFPQAALPWLVGARPQSGATWAFGQEEGWRCLRRRTRQSWRQCSSMAMSSHSMAGEKARKTISLAGWMWRAGATQ